MKIILWILIGLILDGIVIFMASLAPTDSISIILSVVGGFFVGWACMIGFLISM